MAIFRRSKNKPTTSNGQPQSKTNQEPQPPSYALTSNPNWSYVEQQSPNSPYGNAVGHVGQQSQGWLVAPVPPQYQPVFVTQPPPKSSKLYKGGGNLSTLKLASVVNLLGGDVPESVPGARYFNNGAPRLRMQGSQYFNQATPLCDLISSKFDAVITLIDGERFSGDVRELAVFAPPQPMWQQEQQANGYTDREVVRGKSKGMVNNSVSTALTSTNYFAKVNLYVNSRLPPNLPPMKLYMPTFPLLCLAAQYSERVYTKPSGQEKETHVDSDWRVGTKAMVIKSVPMDDMNTIVFAIRGTQTFMDWAVNLRSAPVAPTGFLDDPGNLCHAGFLAVAQKMIKPVAARLRNLLQEDPSRSKCSLLITGHSAGGAVAALLYSHMLATTPETESELNILTGCFKRIHCISFGAPPVSLLPLTKPTHPSLRKSLFYSFVNEGDPVPRADKAYIRSLLDLYSSPAPGQSCTLTSGFGKSSSSLTIYKPKKSKIPAMPEAPYWPVPESALSNAGRIVLLRSVEKYENKIRKGRNTTERMNEGVVAQIVTDDLLRGVIWGDPVCHMMALYSRRIEILATNAVTGRS